MALHMMKANEKKVGGTQPYVGQLLSTLLSNESRYLVFLRPFHKSFRVDSTVDIQVVY